MSISDKRIRVLIVDDSRFMRKVMYGLITADPQMEIVGEAQDGRQAVELAQSLQPDVITMDINMPHLNGLEATEIIMAQNPRPIVIVSSESREGAQSTLRALELGAIDFVTKPTAGIDLNMDTVQGELTRKLKVASRVHVIRTATPYRRPAAAPRVAPPPEVIVGHPTTPPSPHVLLERTADGEPFPIVVIAASTGGPATLMRLIPGFPRDFPAALLLALHMPANFTAQFAEQLAEIAPIHVKQAESGEQVRPGALYLCPGSHHMRVTSSGHIQLLDGEDVPGYRPSADLAMRSAVEFAGPMTIGVVLTGMGNDAAKGAITITAAGGHVIAQDEATSVIFGMPCEAIKTGAVDEILALEEIVPAIEKRVAQLLGAVQAGAV
jgi:two-component system chemotaxis response regulator CheB